LCNSLCNWLLCHICVNWFTYQHCMKLIGFLYFRSIFSAFAGKKSTCPIFIFSRSLCIVITLIFSTIKSESFAQVTNLYTQNFSTGTAFPTGWIASGSPTWTVSSGTSSTPTPTFSGGSNLSASSSGSARTVTFSNNLSTIGYTNITILWAARRSYSKTVTFEWSPDATNWNTVTITDVSANSTWAWVNGGTRIALPAGAAGIANLSCRWTYDSDGTAGVYRIDDFTVEGCQIPNQPSVITGNVSPCNGSSQVYSVTNVAGLTYTWTFPAGWSQTAGGTTNTITVTAGVTSGNITVTPSNSCGSGSPRSLAVLQSPFLLNQELLAEVFTLVSALHNHIA
jgi:hypothetical protein